MKKLLIISILITYNIGLAQVGIGTINPDPNVMLDVNGKLKVSDGNQGENKVLVSDANGIASWSNESDGVKTKIIRVVDQGTSTEVTLWIHLAGIEVKFDPGTEKVTVINNTGDSSNYWDVVIEGDARTASGDVGYDQYIKNYLLEGDSLSIDLGNVDSGWFRILASDQKNQLDGFFLNIMYYNDDLNGFVQFWDN